MKMHITGRGIEITPALRKTAEEKLSKLERFLTGAIEAHVVLTVEKRRHQAEITVRDRLATLTAAAETSDMYSSMGLGIDRLVRQAKRHHEKFKTVRRRKGHKTSPRQILDLVPAAPPDGPRVVPVRRSPLKPMTVEEALLQVRGTEREFLVFRNSTSRRISVLYRRKDGNYGLIEPEG